MRRQALPMAAFTLIELLVVIAIIAILAAILFPVFARARAKGQQTACLSNVKQLDLAMNAYATDYDGRYFTVTNAYTQLDPYIKNSQIWLCPTATNATWGWIYSYVFNNWYYWDTNLCWEGVPQGAIPDAASVIALGDGQGPYRSGDVVSGVSTSAGLQANPPVFPDVTMGNENWAAWHFGQCNFGFLDGHAKSMTLDSVATNTFNPRPGESYPGTVYYYLCIMRAASY